MEKSFNRYEWGAVQEACTKIRLASKQLLGRPGVAAPPNTNPSSPRMLAQELAQLTATEDQPVGVIVVDHGSRRQESNELLLAVAEMFRQQSQVTIVEPAHMELAEPSIADAFASCVQQGAKLVVVFPYFLSPGRHWSEDIPRLAAKAAAQHPSVKHLVTAPLGLHALIGQVMSDRIVTCLSHHTQGSETCDLCVDRAQCQLR